MDELTSETCLALNNEIKKQVTTSWSLFIQMRESYFAILEVFTTVLTNVHFFWIFNSYRLVNTFWCLWLLGSKISDVMLLKTSLTASIYRSTKYSRILEALGAAFKNWGEISYQTNYSSMVQRLSWRTCFLSQTRIAPTLSYPKFHYRVYKSPPLVSILSHIDDVQFDLLKILFNIILSSMPPSSKRILSLGYHHQKHVSKFSFPMHATCQTNLIIIL